MPKDLKIGLAVGLGVVFLAVIWLATRPSLTPKARLASASARQGANPHLYNPETQNETGPRTDAQYVSNENSETEIVQSGPSTQKPESNIQNPAMSIEIPESEIPNEQTEPIKTEKFYIVRKNDTLSSISQKYYGSATKWPKIFDANRRTISDANKLPIGAKLIIPD
jgi:nucleoid-associated protein YgaU